MSENSEDLGINLDSSVKKLLKAQYPNLNLRTPVVKALSICALKVYFLLFLTPVFRRNCSEIGRCLP